MHSEENQYGRARVKKAKPMIASAEPNAEQQAPPKNQLPIESQTAMELPIKPSEKPSEISKASQAVDKAEKFQQQQSHFRERSKERTPAKFERRERQDRSDQTRRVAHTKPSYQKPIRVSVIIPAFNEQDNLKP